MSVLSDTSNTSNYFIADIKSYLLESSWRKGKLFWKEVCKFTEVNFSLYFRVLSSIESQPLTWDNGMLGFILQQDDLKWINRFNRSNQMCLYRTFHSTEARRAHTHNQYKQNKTEHHCILKTNKAKSKWFIPCSPANINIPDHTYPQTNF